MLLIRTSVQTSSHLTMTNSPSPKPQPNRSLPRSGVVFLKLGGSLITDKTQAYTVRRNVISRLATEVRQALDSAPQMGLVVGHGSGSFGHWAAKPFGTRDGVRTPAEWRGYAEVAIAAARLNRVVVDAFFQAGVPVLSVQPSASARCHDGRLVHLDSHPIREALAHALVPLVHGDVCLDDTRGGTIISTEDIFVFLTSLLHPSRILLAGETPGVLDPTGATIPQISPHSFPSLRDALAGSHGVDVTGGMQDKVARMVQLVQRHPEVRVRIFTGTEPHLLARALRGAEPQTGTRITVALED